MEKHFVELYCKDILNEVKSLIKKNHMKLLEPKSIEVDKKMLDIIESLVIKEKKGNEVNYTLKVLSLTSDEKERVITTLVLNYVALYNDNMELLNKLLDNNYNFKENCYYDNINLFVLDKRISSKFSFQEYLDILKNNIKLFQNFWISLISHSDNITDDDAIERFTSLLKKNPKIAFDSDGNFKYEHLLKREVLTLLSDSDYESLSFKQKEILDDKTYLNDDEYKFVVKLVKDFGVDYDLIYWSNFREDFDISQIANFSDENIDAIRYLYFSLFRFDNKEMYRKKAIAKLRKVLESDPSYSIHLSVLAYNTLGVKQLSKVSEDTAERIKWIIWHLTAGEDGIGVLSKAILKPLIIETYYSGLLKDNVKRLLKK